MHRYRCIRFYLKFNYHFRPTTGADFLYSGPVTTPSRNARPQRSCQTLPSCVILKSSYRHYGNHLWLQRQRRRHHRRQRPDLHAGKILLPPDAQVYQRRHRGRPNLRRSHSQPLRLRQRQPRLQHRSLRPGINKRSAPYCIRSRIYGKTYIRCKLRYVS